MPDGRVCGSDTGRGGADNSTEDKCVNSLSFDAQANKGLVTVAIIILFSVTPPPSWIKKVVEETQAYTKI